MRVTGKDKVKAKESCLGATLGEESTGMVVIDYDGHPIRFNQLSVYEDIVATHRSVRFDVESVSDGFSWRRASSSVDIDEDTLDDQTRERIAKGIRNLREDAFVKACLTVLFVFVHRWLSAVIRLVWTSVYAVVSLRACACVYACARECLHLQEVTDPHLDAKVFPCAHPCPVA